MVYYVGVSLILDRVELGVYVYKIGDEKNHSLIKRPETAITILCINVLFEIIIRHKSFGAGNSSDLCLVEVFSRHLCGVELSFDYFEQIVADEPILDPRFVCAREKAFSFCNKIRYAVHDNLSEMDKEIFQRVLVVLHDMHI